MSLNESERRQTSNELKSNLALSGLSPEEVAEDLGFTPRRLQSALDVDVSGTCGPVDVWLLRDYLEQAVRDAGHQPIAHSVLTEPARRLARTWFALRDAPRHTFTTS